MTDADLAGASIRLRNWATLNTTDPYAIEIFRADILGVLADRERLEANNAEKDKTNARLYAENLEIRAERDVWKGRALGLQDERDRLAADLDVAARQREHVARLEDNLRAVGSWARSNLKTLNEAQRDWRQSSANAGKIAVLEDLISIVDHLDAILADAARFNVSESSRHDSPQCAPAGGGCACQGGGS